MRMRTNCVSFMSRSPSVLPADRGEPGEDAEDVATRVQAAIAKALDVKATKHTSSDKVEHAKRTFFVPSGRSAFP